MKYDTEKFFNLSLDMLCIAGVDGYFKLINPSFTRTLGWDEKALLGKPFTDFIHPDDIESTLREVEQLSSGIPTVSFQNRYRRVDGSYRWLLWTAYPDPDTGLLYAVARDITEGKLAQERFFLAIEASPAGMLMVNGSGEIVFANQEAGRIFGYQSEELIGKNIEMLVPENFREQHPNYRQGFQTHPIKRPMGTRRSLMAVRKDKSEFPVEIGLSPIRTEDQDIVLGAVVDLTYRKNAEAKILEQSKKLIDANKRLVEIASTDALTKLNNRRAFQEQFIFLIKNAFRYQSPLSILLMDVDDFKSYNDTYGHLEGDEVLRKIADILVETARGSDFLARFGGEEFSIILTNTDIEGALLSAERYRKAIQDFEWPVRKLTASIGAATYSPSPNEDLDFNRFSTSLINEADKALYDAKLQGKNQISHFDNLSE